MEVMQIIVIAVVIIGSGFFMWFVGNKYKK
jgi:hypothetical protein